ncbi:unnamed protein product [Withania somnifera]
MSQKYCTSTCLILIFVLVVHAFAYSAESRRPFACDRVNVGTRNLRFCNTALPIHVRVQDLIGRLTLQEKVRLLVNNAAPVERLGVNGYEWWSEALHGVSNTGPGVKFGGAFPGATSFPQVITTAASFNTSLWEEIGRVVSDEGRAMYNGGAAGLTFWSPNVNILRDPRWGRSQETPGEDPHLVAQYAVSYVKGLQGGRGSRLKVAACCKHYTAYDLDYWNGFDRYHFNARVSMQDLEDTYNVPFKACVVEGNVASVMCSYNQINGKPSCADPKLLRDTIRAQWHLKGYIVSDCDSVGVLFDQQHYTRFPEDAAAATIKAGLDLDCGPFLAIHTEQAVRTGKVSELEINYALANTITVQMRLGMFDGPNGPYANLGPKDVCTPAHQQLALQAAREGIVLLKNIGQALPLSSQHHQTVAVIGPNSDATVTMIGNYAGVPCGYISPLQGITRYARTPSSPGHQQELISRVAMASKGPVVLVLMSGGPIDVTFAKNDPRVSAILWPATTGQPLPMTWYPQDYVAKLAMTNMDMRANPGRGYPGRTYRFYKGPTVFPFGAGFSYTKFGRRIVFAPATILQVRTKHTNCELLDLDIHIDVKNIGDMDGTHTILIFSTSSPEMKQLVAFEKVHVVSGAKRRVKIGMNACKQLSIVDKYGIRRIFMGEQKIYIADELQHSITFQASLKDIKL